MKGQKPQALKVRRLIPANPAKADETVDNQTSLLGDHSEREPPDPISNSEVKPLSADDSVDLSM